MKRFLIFTEQRMCVYPFQGDVICCKTVIK
jgi:hypothetical protein